MILVEEDPSRSIVVSGTRAQHTGNVRPSLDGEPESAGDVNQRHEELE
jgi:hypothetical protein